MRKHQIGKKIASVALAAALTVTTVVTGGFGKLTAQAAAPPVQDSASAVNYATILGRGVDFGIVANKFQQRNHMETTMAVDYFANYKGDFNTIDLIPKDSTAQILLGHADTERGVDKPFVFDATVAHTINIEGGPEAMAGFNGHSSSGYFVFDNVKADVVAVTNNKTSDNIQAILNNAYERSDEIQRKIDNGYAVDYHDDKKKNEGDKIVLDFASTNEFVNKVVYVDVDNEFLNVMDNGDGFRIIKDPSTVVVFNINDNAGTNSGDGILILEYKVSLDGGATWIDTTAYSDHNNDPKVENETRKNDREICQKVIFNITSTKKVSVGNTSGLFIIPNSPLVDVRHTCAGWIVADNLQNSAGEWHYIYDGGSQEFQKDNKGEIHFAARKAFTHNYHGKDTLEDTTVFCGKDLFKFNWYETGSDYAISGLPIDTIGNKATNTVKFPVLTFYSDDAHKTDPHFVGVGDSEDFYFVITEDSGSTGIENVELSNGKIEIHLNVINNNGILEYYVDSVTTLGDGTVYKRNSNVHMSGVEFFFRRIFQSYKS